MQSDPSVAVGGTGERGMAKGMVAVQAGNGEVCMQWLVSIWPGGAWWRVAKCGAVNPSRRGGP